MSPLSIGAGILIYLLALLIHISDLDKERPSYYHTLFSLFIFSSVGMIITGDLFNLFIFIEIGRPNCPLGDLIAGPSPLSLTQVDHFLKHVQPF